MNFDSVNYEFNINLNINDSVKTKISEQKVLLYIKLYINLNYILLGADIVQSYFVVALQICYFLLLAESNFQNEKKAKLRVHFNQKIISRETQKI